MFFQINLNVKNIEIDRTNRQIIKQIKTFLKFIYFLFLLTFNMVFLFGKKKPFFVYLSETKILNVNLLNLLQHADNPLK